MGNTGFSKSNVARVIFHLPILVVFALSLLIPLSARASETLCAEVKIEIAQELTLERQAFDAHMRINNGLSHIALEDIAVEVSFTDEEGEVVLASSDPDNPDAIFFIKVDSMQNIDDISGTGTIEPSTSADIHWLIIPAPGASNGLEMGTLYYVGARLTYTFGGEEHMTEVMPDYIFVKPMPELVLDYFIPEEVYGDDAFTTEIEPPIPFTLGVRVKNNGYGTARELKIDSAQPKIVENELGLLIGFVIEGSHVNDEPASESLLADFGSIEPNASKVARWIMTCTLSGTFVEFDAEFSHSDELGGELTSLIQEVNTHFLVRDVLVDAQGRDSIRDFLARDGSVYRVYESESTETEVYNQSAASTLNGSGDLYTLSTPVTAGLIFVKLPDPHYGQKEISEVIRSDGKNIGTENAWLSKTRNGQAWDYFINLFDANSTGSYTVTFGDPSSQSHAPVLQFIPDRSFIEGETLAFIVEASDPDGTIPSLNAAPLPALAEFEDQGDGMGRFEWTAATGQAGKYEITFSASDGVLEDSQRAIITVCSIDDTDGDNMLDAWEMEHFGTLDRDGTGDFDGDGISDLDEFLNGTDPTTANRGPTIPGINAPGEGEEVNTLRPELVILNSIDQDGDTITYDFEIYSDQEMTNLVAGTLDQPEGVDTTSWELASDLIDNAWYFWRVRANDGALFSQWAYGHFFINMENDPPGVIHVSSPRDNIDVDTQTPVLTVTNSVDLDEDLLSYTFEVYADSDMSTLAASASNVMEGEGGATSWVVDSPLDEGAWYYWRVIVTDEHGATEETTAASFLVNTDNIRPQPPQISSP
ncbi:MAG: hypothetical protein SV775_17430 [Thermodesulfobacteriota bacterium]|nr:hypothetical protein [Thermodesulfobacteriota bacterium]